MIQNELLILGYISVILLMALSIDSATEPEQTKYNELELFEVLNNPAVYNQYLQCILSGEDSYCTATGKRTKDDLKNNCQNCEPSEKMRIRKALEFIRQMRPDDYHLIKQKYPNIDKLTIDENSLTYKVK